MAEVTGAVLRPAPSASVSVQVNASVSVDRIVIEEDQSGGQAIRKYSVQALIGGEYRTVSSGTSVGNKKIDLLREDVAGATEFRLNILESASPTVRVRRFAVRKCQTELLPTITVIS